MAVRVYLVDQVTHLKLPDTQWGFDVREKLTQMGHEVRATSLDPDSCVRNEMELLRVDKLLESTGI